ncbi:MAG: SHOCT domain-containing protein [Xanthobacteraceae bacterium]
MSMGLFLTLLALVGIIAIMVWIVQLPFVALLINIGLIAVAAWIVQGPFVALLAIIGFVAVILSALRWATAQDIRRHDTATPEVGTALDVLNARYARGDIDQAEYREMRALIASRTGGEA